MLRLQSPLQGKNTRRQNTMWQDHKLIELRCLYFGRQNFLHVDK